MKTPRLLLGLALLVSTTALSADEPAREARPHLKIRGIYGGAPSQIFDRGETLDDYAINAVWIGSAGATAAAVSDLKAKAPGVKVFAEFNTMHDSEFLDDQPDAAPVGPDGERSPAPDGWQGICPSHEGHRRARMTAFRKTLTDAPIDGIWLDYHHAHASWERAEPDLPDTCFCPRCLKAFTEATGIPTDDGPVAVVSARLLGERRREWVDWRCDVFTDWVREFRAIVDEIRPGALLGTFHCPWTVDERDGGLRDKLAIDLKAQSRHLDVFSIMPYHARFGHADDPAWISRQTAWLGEYLGVRGEPGERLEIWPIVQIADWGDRVTAGDVAAILDHGTRSPATGVTIFHWSGVGDDRAKLKAIRKAYRGYR